MKRCANSFTRRANRTYRSTSISRENARRTKLFVGVYCGSEPVIFMGEHHQSISLKLDTGRMRQVIGFVRGAQVLNGNRVCLRVYREENQWVLCEEFWPTAASIQKIVGQKSHSPSKRTSGQKKQKAAER